MSLLMDALKKAEQEKKEAAKRLKEAQDQKSEELELAEDSQPGVTEPPEEELIEEQSAVTSEVEISDEGPEPLSLEVMESGEESEIQTSLAPSEDEKLQEKVEDITIEHPEISVPELSIKEEVQEDTEIEKPLADPDQTFAFNDMGLEEQIEQETPDISFEDTQQSEEPEKIFDDTISESKTVTSIITAEELARDIGGGKDQPTPVAAQTVFTAVSSGSERQGYNWVLFLALCLVVTVSLSVIYYFVIVPSNIDSSSPLVAKGIETDPGSLPVIEIPEEILQGTIITGTGDKIEETSTVEESELSETETETETESDIGEEELKDDIASEISPVDTAVEESGITLTDIIPEDVVKAIPVITGKKFPEPSEKQALAQQQTLPQDIEVEPAAIKITRSKTKEKDNEIINTAFAEYNKGNYAAAENNYLKVLNTKPENRDALLGLAAIAQIKGDLQGAYTYYRNVLKLYPHDNIARTALISMQDRNNPEQSESTIKLMLQDEPDAAFLHFVLGNIYARQSRWSDAQQSFFDAYRRDSTNADYAYNLAVSLDHIGKSKTALDYYNVALQLADNGIVNFNTATVLTRIDKLSNPGNTN